MSVRIWLLCIVCFLISPRISSAQSKMANPKPDKLWIVQSNKYTQHLVDIDEKYSPEFGSDEGISYYDTLVEIATLPNLYAQRKEKADALAFIKNARQKETNTFLLQDLQILIYQTELDFKREDFKLNREVSYMNAANTVFDGIRSLLDDQTPAERRNAATIRLRKYAGLEKGFRPIIAIYRERTAMQMEKQDMIYPSRQELELALTRNSGIINGIQDLFIKYKLTGWENAYSLLKKQLGEYDAWVTDSLLPKTRIDFRLPPEKYKLELEGYGIDIPPAEIAKLAHHAFSDIQDQMKPIAAAVAAKYHLPSNDYRSVIQYLKKNQIVGDSIMIVYKNRLADIENIIRVHQLVTLPDRPAMIRLASEAETVRQPAPHMQPPPFLNNTGQRGVFVLPLNMPTPPGEKIDSYDDFTFDAAAWTIIAHEARPGHELQFDKMVEEGVSTARVLYAFNSANVEGWGLYSEYIMLPFMPLEGQLVSLDYRLLRAARAFLDPELQAGIVTQQQALDLLMKDVVSSHAFARQEVERYSLRAPGQANSYFYGFIKMLALRKDTEFALGSQFNVLRFHDFILSQGILPPALLREAVMSDFIKQEKTK